MTATRKCPTCLVELPLEAFGSNKTKKPACLACRRAYNNAWHARPEVKASRKRTRDELDAVDAPKRCSRCAQEKKRSEFSSSLREFDGKANWCKACTSEHNKELRTDPETRRKRRDRNLKRLYGMSIEAYEVELQRQRGVCAICLQPPTTERPLAVDHCHATTKVRMLLCYPCNTGLGFFKDDPERLQRAVEYVKNFRWAFAPSTTASEA